MNRNTYNSISNRNISPEVPCRDAITSTESHPIPDDEFVATSSTYASFFWLFNYIKMYTIRLVNDLVTSFMIYWYPTRDILPAHIVNLMQVQRRIRAERESHTVTYSRYKLINHSGVKSAIERSTQTISLVPENNTDRSPHGYQ